MPATIIGPSARAGFAAPPVLGPPMKHRGGQRKADPDGRSRQHPIALSGSHLHLTGDHGDPGALVHLVITQRVPGRNLDRDPARVLARGENRRGSPRKRKEPDVPVPHELDPKLAEAYVPGTHTRRSAQTTTDSPAPHHVGTASEPEHDPERCCSTYSAGRAAFVSVASTRPSAASRSPRGTARSARNGRSPQDPESDERLRPGPGRRSATRPTRSVADCSGSTTSRTSSASLTSGLIVSLSVASPPASISLI